MNKKLDNKTIFLVIVMRKSNKQKGKRKHHIKKRKKEGAMTLKIKNHKVKPLKLTGAGIRKIKEDLVNYEKDVLGFDDEKAKRWATLATKPLLRT